MPVLTFDRRFEDHDTGAHPECPARIAVLREMLERTGLHEQFTRGTVRAATDEELLRLHTSDHVARIGELAESGGGRIDADTVVSPASDSVARLAVGSALEAVDRVLDAGERACCLVRPPGHHALSRRAMGFCLYGNAALAAAHAVAAHDVNRVLVIDFDVHHGNGTQDLFYERQDVTFFSAHRHPFWPFSGTREETGTGAGLGHTFNLPLDAKTPPETYHDRFRLMLDNACAASDPELIVLSAGFDAHWDDPIGGLNLSAEDFASLTQTVRAAADAFCEGRLLSVLEGGYNLDALAESVEAHLRELL